MHCSQDCLLLCLSFEVIIYYLSFICLFGLLTHEIFGRLRKATFQQFLNCGATQIATKPVCSNYIGFITFFRVKVSIHELLVLTSDSLNIFLSWQNKIQVKSPLSWNFLDQGWGVWNDSPLWLARNKKYEFKLIAMFKILLLVATVLHFGDILRLLNNI